MLRSTRVLLSEFKISKVPTLGAQATSSVKDAKLHSPNQTTQQRFAEQTELKPLHIYRSLLRAATYIPDSHAQVILKGLIKKYFLDTKLAPRRDTATSKDSPDGKYSPKSRYRKRLLRAASEARCLERAGQGNKEDLEKVLLIAYGRRGRRRRELVQQLIKPDEDELTFSSALQDGLAHMEPESVLKVAQTRKMRTFLHSQVQRKTTESSYARPGGKQRGTKPHIDKENIWGRPMPRGRQVNIARKWWAGTLDRLQPPLPLAEWERLQALSRGKIPVPKLIPRRAQPPEKPKDDDEVAVEVLKKLKDARAGGDITFDPQRGLSVIPDPPKEGELGHHSSYQRSMRRLYASIWHLTSWMNKNEATKEWTIQWGGLKSEAHEAKFPKATSEKDRKLFAALEAEDLTKVKKADTGQEPLSEEEKARRKEAKKARKAAWEAANPDKVVAPMTAAEQKAKVKELNRLAKEQLLLKQKREAKRLKYTSKKAKPFGNGTGSVS